MSARAWLMEAVSTMSYQYAFCPTCGLRRTGHGHQCSVCGGLLRHETVRRPAPSTDLRSLQPSVRWQAPAPASAPAPERQPVAA
jgi:hypothetical protein